MKRLLIPFIALALCPPAQAHSNKELWSQYETQVNSVDARVEAVAVKTGASHAAFHLAIRARLQRFRACMQKNRRADFLQAEFACQIEQEVEF